MRGFIYVGVVLSVTVVFIRGVRSLGLVEARKRFLVGWMRECVRTWRPNAGCSVVHSLKSPKMFSYLALMPHVLKLFGESSKEVAEWRIWTDVVETHTYLKTPRWLCKCHTPLWKRIQPHRTWTGAGGTLLSPSTWRYLHYLHPTGLVWTPGLGALADTKSLRTLFYFLCTWPAFVSRLNPVQLFSSHLFQSTSPARRASQKSTQPGPESFPDQEEAQPDLVWPISSTSLAEGSGQREQLLEQYHKAFDVSLAMAQMPACLWKAAFPTNRTVKHCWNVTLTTAFIPGGHQKEK